MSLPLGKISNQQDRNRRLAKLLLSNGILTTNYISSNNFFEIKKLSSDENSSQILEEYRKLREECDKKAYSVAWLDAIGEKITDAIAPAIRPIIKTVQSATSSTKPIAEGVTDQSEKVVTEIIEKASSVFPEKDRFCKIAKIYDPYINEINIAERSILLYASQEGIKASSLEELSYKINIISKKAGTAGASGIAEMVGKGLKGIGRNLGTATVKSIPFIGIATDLTLMCKNIYEAWNNGKKIILDLPLDKYGISVSDATIPTPGNTAKISKKLESLCIEYKDSPSNLSEILNISQTLKGYGTDFVSIITNLLMVILDILEFTGLGLLVSFVLSIPIMALEMANDSLVEECYDKSINLIRSICDEKISELSSVSFTTKEKDFMRSFLSQKDSRVSEEGKKDSPIKDEVKSARLSKLDYFMRVSH